jgi:hypothetical protein
MKRLIVIAILATLNPLANAQELQEQDFSRVVDELVSLQEDDASYEDLYENLIQLMAHPIDLNTATRDDIQRLHLLSVTQVDEFMRYRNENGKLISLHELQTIPGFDLATIQNLLPFVTLIDPQQRLNTSFLQRAFQKDNTYLITRVERTLETRKGFSNTEDPEKKFRGSEDKLYFRFRNSRPGDFSFGFTAEKDAGEQLQWHPSKSYYGMDFFSYHAQLMNKGKIKNLVLGDFQCQAGQGLILGNAFGLGKGAETITTTRRNNLGTLPYTSANENGFFRGISTTVQLNKKFSVTGFYSSLLRDGTVSRDSSGQQFLSSFQNSGLHRSADESSGRKKITEKNWGGVLNYQVRNMEAGLIVHHITFIAPVTKEYNVYNRFSFNGRENTNLGGYLNYHVSNFNFFSEVARSVSAGKAMVAGMMASLHPNFDMAVVYRKFDRNFYSFYGNPFSENTSPQNETAFYWGWKYRWNRKYSTSGYVDQFKFPWLSFRRYAPSHGYEWLLRFNYQPDRKTLMFIQAREELKPRNQSDELNLYTIARGRKRNFWVAIHYSAGEHIKLKSRIQYSTFSIHSRHSEGLTLLQDITLSAGKLQLTARHALFDTDDFDNRQYVYENDVWLAFSLPAYEGRGTRNYILLEYKVSKKISLWLRYSRTRFTDREEIGNGSEQIEGNTKNDLKFQAVFKF